jgi:hypothetical protein
MDGVVWLRVRDNSKVDIVANLVWSPSRRIDPIAIHVAGTVKAMLLDPGLCTDTLDCVRCGGCNGCAAVIC